MERMKIEDQMNAIELIRELGYEYATFYMSTKHAYCLKVNNLPTFGSTDASALRRAGYLFSIYNNIGEEGTDNYGFLLQLFKI